MLRRPSEQQCYEIIKWTVGYLQGELFVMMCLDSFLTSHYNVLLSLTGRLWDA